jgi:Zinc knuckle
MDIDALTPEDRTNLMRRGACFTCRQTGHLSRDCPKKNQNYRPSTNSGNEKKKWNAKDIHAMIKGLSKEENEELANLQIGDADF